METVNYTAQLTAALVYSAGSWGLPLTEPNCYRWVYTGERSALTLFCALSGLTHLPEALRAYAPQTRVLFRGNPLPRQQLLKQQNLCLWGSGQRLRFKL